MCKRGFLFIAGGLFVAVAAVWLGLALRQHRSEVRAETVLSVRLVHNPDQSEDVTAKRAEAFYSFSFRDRRCAEWFASVLSGCFPVAESAPSIVEEAAK
jgi:hypothetical protein